MPREEAEPHGNKFTRFNLYTMRVAIAILYTGIMEERRKKNYVYLQLLRGTICVIGISYMIVVHYVSLVA